MNKLMLPAAFPGALAVAFTALAAMTGGPANAATAHVDYSSFVLDPAAREISTIPAARPGLPQSQRGAEGPIRSSGTGQAGTDPSIRDSNPLTVNGLWETLPGNVITAPRPQ